MTSLPTTFVPDYSDLLVQLVAESDNEYAALKALHGNFGKWEAFRVALKSAILLEARAAEPPAGAKSWTDELLKAAAHADPRYLAFIKEGAKQGTRFHDIAEARGEIAQQESARQFGGVR